MKRLLFIFCSTLFFVACDVNERIEDELTLEQVLGLGSEAGLQLSAPAYASLRDFVKQDGLWGVNQHSSDETLGPTRGSDWDDNGIWRQLHTHTWDPNHTFIGIAFNDLSRGVSRTNSALSTLTQDPDANSQLIAEVRTLRAIFAFYLMDMFGQVPTREIDDTNFSQPGTVLNRTEAFDFVETELQESLADLPTEGDVPFGRMTQNAARTMLAVLNLNHAVYLGAENTSRYQNVVDFTSQVISGGSFALTSQENYFKMFNNDNTETRAQGEGIIAAVFNDEDDLAVNNALFLNQTMHYNQRWGGGDGNGDGFLDFAPWNGFTTIADFYNRFEDGDPRMNATDDEDIINGIQRGFLIGQQTDEEGRFLVERVSSQDNGQVGVVDPADANTPLLIYTLDVNLQGNTESNGVRVVKYQPDVDSPQQTRADFDYILFRISDVYLMRAEAQFRLNGGGDADLNAVRSARGLTPVTISEDAILNERGFELYWEGHRRRDLIRFGRFTDAYTLKGETEPFREVFPTPQSAIDADPNLDPTLGNPGGG